MRLPEVRALVQQAFDLGYDVAIATNPLFPRQAILHRLGGPALLTSHTR